MSTAISNVEGVAAEESLILEIKDNDTYVTKLSVIEGAHATWFEDMTSPSGTVVDGGTSVSISGTARTLTFYAPGVTHKRVFVNIKGRL